MCKQNEYSKTMFKQDVGNKIDKLIIYKNIMNKDLDSLLAYLKFMNDNPEILDDLEPYYLDAIHFLGLVIENQLGETSKTIDYLVAMTENFKTIQYRIDEKNEGEHLCKM